MQYLHLRFGVINLAVFSVGQLHMRTQSLQ